LLVLHGSSWLIPWPFLTAAGGGRNTTGGGTLCAMIRALADSDAGPVAEFTRLRWGSPVAVSQGRLHRLDALPGFVAISDDGGRIEGLVTYLVEDGECEVISLDAVREGRGIGSALLELALDAARAAGCRQVRLVTTNDNMRALRFYQRRGFRLVALNAGALERSRQLKPEIPATGAHGIPLRDELLLARDL
jgi:GNAT superfamily N-acetyltransferase